MSGTQSVFENIHNHRSIRKYKQDAVPEELLEKILNAALRASSSGNMQAYSVIVTTDSGLRKELGPAHFDQSMVQDAPVLMTFCADFHRMRRWIALKDAPENFDNYMSFMIAAIDATLAAQNAALAAEALGLGICFLGTTLASCGDIARILNCPSHVVPVVGFTLGFPDEMPAPRDRLPLDGMVHRDRYRDLKDEDILGIYKDRERAGWDRYMANDELRRMVEESGVKNLAQIYTKLKYTRESHIGYSEHVLTCLRERGFSPA